MKKKNISKKVLAVILSVIMIVTSLPLMIVSAIGEGLYDPAPYWGDGSNNAAVNTNFVATIGTDGSVSISFPKANPAATWDTYTDATPTKKTITNYIFTLTKLADDGTRVVIWSENFENKNYTSATTGVFTITEGAEYPNNIYYAPGGLTGLAGYDIEASYDVGIVAVDSDGWVSDAIHTRLTEVPYYNISADFSPNEKWIARTMLEFEAAGTANVDEGDYKIYSGSSVNVDGAFAETGYNGTNSYHFWINSTDSSTPFSMQTTWSRSHYDFTNAEEVWFYVDFSRVDISKVAFSVTANEKDVEHWRDDTTNYTSHYGTLFSTKEVNGVNEGTVTDGIYIQNSDGLWEQSSMTDGYFTNLGGYEGFIRIPIDYFVLQSDQYIVADNDMANWTSEGNGNANSLNTYANKHYFASGATMVVPDSKGNTRTLTTTTYNSKVAFKINDAGTPVTDAYIIYDRTEKSTRIFQTNTHEMGPMISDDNVVSVSGTTYTVTDPQFAIEDLVSAGIEVSGWSSESLAKAFDIDQVMFCRHEEITTSDYNTSTGAVTNTSVGFPGENGDFATDYGYVVGTYYDRTVEVPKAVANYIMQYFGEVPSLDDVNAKALIDDIIKTYLDCFPGCTTVAQAIEYLKTNHLEAYNRYKSSEEFIIKYVGSGLDTTTTAVESFESGVEALPNAEFASHTDTNLQDSLKQLMALYETFNLSHFELLGADAEAKFLDLYNLVMGEEVKTGYSIGAYPFIPFNDFETNYTLGQLSDIYYDNAGLGKDRANDVNGVGNFTTFVSEEYVNQTSLTSNAIGWSVQVYSPTAKRAGTLGISEDAYINDTGDSNANGLYARMDAIISNDGFADSLGATVRINGDLNSSSDTKFGTLSVTYKGTDLYDSGGSFSQLPGLNLRGMAVTTDTTNGTDAEDTTRYGEGVIPNSFVMFVDFTNIVDQVDMNIKFILDDGTGEDFQTYFCGGGINDSVVFYTLDENGEWAENTLTATYLDQNNPFFDNEEDKALCSIGHADLVGYKGFIRIPLSNFRMSKGGNDVQYLDNMINDGYTIKQAKISFWDYTGNNADTTINIDALGFTYDPACKTRQNGDVMGLLNQDNGIDIKNMDEYFQVKTNDSSNFEKMVSTIDPYASEDEFKASFEACQAAYSALSSYQKTIPEVKYCYETLLVAKYQLLYLNYDSEIQNENWKPYYTATTDTDGNTTSAVTYLLNDLATVSQTAKEYSIEDESLSQLYNTHKDDYLTALGFTTLEEAQKVVDMYELGYYRLSIADRSTITSVDYEYLTNAYNAARRAILISGIIDDVDEFKANITNIYGKSTHTDDDADRIPDAEDADGENRMVKYAGTVTDADGNEQNALKYYTDIYVDISVFGKKLLGDDTDIAAAYMNMYDAAEAILDNSTTVSPMAGEAVEGGIVTYEKRLEAAYADVKAKIDSKTVLDTATLDEIEYCLGQYEVFLRRYALVDELNYDYVELALLLPTADLATTDSVTLTNADAAPLYKDTADADLTYVAARLNRTVSVYIVTDYKWTQTTGSTYDFGYYTVNGATGTDGSVVYTKLGDYENGVTAALAPEISIDETAAKKVPTGAQYEGVVTLMAFDSALVTDGVDMSTLEPVSTVEIPVMFVSTNGSNPIFYTVEIPADMEVEWDQITAENVSYTVKNASLNGGTLTVGVADNTGNFDATTNTGKLVNGDNSIVYTASNFADYTFSNDITADTQPNPAPQITIAQEDWDKAAVGKYKTTLTYTVVYDDGTDDGTT